MSWINIRFFSLDQDLAKLAGFLRARRVPHRIIELNGQQILQVPDEALLEPVTQVADAWAAGELDGININNSAPGRDWQQARAQMLAAPITVLLILLSALGFAVAGNHGLASWLPSLSFLPIVQADGGYYLSAFANGIGAGQWWRLITPAFLHFSIFHIIFNALWVWELGKRIERVMGPLNYLLFFLVTAALSNLSQYFWSAQPVLFGGMSGVVYAMVGYIAVRQILHPNPLLAIPRGLIVFMLGWLLLCMSGLLDYFMANGIANGAHLGGLLVGAFIGLVFSLAYRNSHKTNGNT